ncbi:MAG: hypothetical protein V3S69_06270 [Dehalococcoidales bacterium]
MFKKIMNIITTIVPSTAVTITKPKGAYVVIIERTWIGRKTTIEMACKEAVRTEMSLLDLL